MAAGSASEPRAGAHLERALELCYRRLGRRDHTTSELRRRLERDGIEVETIARALAVVAEQGYLDDARFALRFAEDRRAVDGWGEARIRARLESVGVERPLIDAALAGLGEEGELEAAVALLRARLRAPPRDDRARQRALALLIRRGYESELAYEAVARFERVAGGPAAA